MKETADKKRLDNIVVFLSNLGFTEYTTFRGEYHHALFPDYTFDFSASGDSPNDISTNLLKMVAEAGADKKMKELRKFLGVK